MSHQFWIKWHREYLHTLNQKLNWQNAQANLDVNDLVFVIDAQTTPLCWSRGRVLETFPGKDGVVRVVSIRVNNTVLKRPVTKLVRLPTFN